MLLDHPKLHTQLRRLRRCGALLVSAFAIGGPIHAAAPGGPFEIVTESHRESAHGPDSGPFATRKVFTYRLKYKGKALSFSAAPSADGSKVEPPQSMLDKAYFLDEPGDSVALVAANGSTFLVTEAQGQPVIERLVAVAFQGYQWLDSAGGQPAPVSLTGPGSGNEPKRLVEGRLLVLLDNSGIKVGVLDIARRTFHSLVHPDPAQRPSQESYDDDYRANGAVPGRARALSPSRSQFVMIGTRYLNDKPSLSLLVVDFVRRKHAIVSLDVDATRLNTLQKATPQWLDRFYAWTTAADGTERLTPRRPVPATPWTGFVTDRAAESAAYRVQPVTQAAVTAFVAYLERNHGAVQVPAKAGESAVKVRIAADLFDIRFYSTNNTLVFEPALGLYTESAIAACQAIAAGYDKQLASGSFQSQFTRLDAPDIWAEH